MKPVYLKQTLRTYSNPAPTAGTESTASAALKTEGPKTSVLQDQLKLSESVSSSPETKTRKLLEQLTKNFPGIQFEITSDTDFLNLKKKAASMGEGKHLLISEAFLARMASSEQDYQECRTMLLSSVLFLAENHGDGVFLGENQAASWNIREKEDSKPKSSLEQMLQNLKQAGSGSGQKWKVSSNVSFETSSLYRKLAQCGTKANIQSVVSEAYQNMASLRLVTCFGEAKERAKAYKAIRSLEKLMVRSRQKIRHLDQENLLKLRKRRAQKKQQEEKVRQIQQELKKKQTQRKLRDRRIVREGEEADQEIRRLKSYLSHMENTQENLHAVSGAETGGGDFLGETAVSAEQIAVSEPVAF